jgi:hypothetical protein
MLMNEVDGEICERGGRGDLRARWTGRSAGDVDGEICERRGRGDLRARWTGRSMSEVTGSSAVVEPIVGAMAGYPGGGSSPSLERIVAGLTQAATGQFRRSRRRRGSLA